MNEVKFLRFGDHDLTSIGTSNLNGCSAVMIASSYGSILAHIAPLPDDHAGNVTAGPAHVRVKMRHFGELYQAHKEFFSTRATGWVVCAVFQGEIALPEQQTIIRHKLEQLGLSSSFKSYVVERGGHLSPGKGTVFVDGKSGDPIVYVEDVVVAGVSLPTVSNWSKWTWNETFRCHFCYRTNSALDGGYEYDYGENISARSWEFYSYLHEKQYFFFENGVSTPLSKCPLNEWVLNGRGWSQSQDQSMKWRLWDGTHVSYSV